MKFRIFASICLVLLAAPVFISGSFALDYSRYAHPEGTSSGPVNDYIGINLQTTFPETNGYIAHSGVGFTLTSARDSDFQVESYLGYRNISTLEGTVPNLNVFDIMMGGAYFPRSPAFSIFGVSPRLKASLLGGIGLSNQATILSTCLSVNLIFSSDEDPSGMTIGASFWPTTTANGVTTRNIACITAGFIFAQYNNFL